MTAAEERAILRWIYRLELAGFPPRIEHVREAVMNLRDEPDDLDAVIGKDWTTRFLNRHPELVVKFSSAFDKKRIKASDPEVLIDHFRWTYTKIHYSGGLIWMRRGL